MVHHSPGFRVITFLIFQSGPGSSRIHVRRGFQDEARGPTEPCSLTLRAAHMLMSAVGSKFGRLCLAHSYAETFTAVLFLILGRDSLSCLLRKFGVTCTIFDYNSLPPGRRMDVLISCLRMNHFLGTLKEHAAHRHDLVGIYRTLYLASPCWTHPSPMV